MHLSIRTTMKTSNTLLAVALIILSISCLVESRRLGEPADHLAEGAVVAQEEQDGAGRPTTARTGRDEHARHEARFRFDQVPPTESQVRYDAIGNNNPLDLPIPNARAEEFARNEIRRDAPSNARAEEFARNEIRRDAPSNARAEELARNEIRRDAPSTGNANPLDLPMPDREGGGGGD